MMKIPAAVVLAALFLCISAPSLSNAEVVEGELGVFGMSCPFCAFGIEKKLRAVSGVSEVTVFLDEGRIHLAFSPENEAVPDDIERAVEEAGFKLSTLQLKVRGTLAEDGPRPVLDAGGKARFLLVDRERRESLSDEAVKRLQAAARDGTVVVSGTVDGEVGGLPALALSSSASKGESQ